MDSMISSARALAGRLGRSKSTVARWIRREEWTFGPGPWRVSEVPAIRSWAAAVIQDTSPRSASPGYITQLGPIKRAELKVKLERGQLLELDRRFRTGELHTRAECENRRRAQYEAAERELLPIADGLPFSPADKAIVRERISKALQRLH